jgi:O-methyltransferase
MVIVPRLLRKLGITRRLPSPVEALPPDLSDGDCRIIRLVRPFTMTGVERLAALIQATRYLARQKIPGDIVECGVWRGGTMMAAALVLLEENDPRHIHLYDTFAGMPPPGAMDKDFDGVPAARQLADTPRGQGVWCACSLGEAKANLASTGFPSDRLHFVQGLVEDTIPAMCPGRLALARLDTDWYASTRHELEHLFPRLVSRGILIIDDYGHWQGARRATDEYFAERSGAIYLHRIDYTGRIGLKSAA